MQQDVHPQKRFNTAYPNTHRRATFRVHTQGLQQDFHSGDDLPASYIIMTDELTELLYSVQPCRCTCECTQARSPILASIQDAVDYSATQAAWPDIVARIPGKDPTSVKTQNATRLSHDAPLSMFTCGPTIPHGSLIFKCESNPFQRIESATEVCYIVGNTASNRRRNAR